MSKKRVKLICKRLNLNKLINYKGTCNHLTWISSSTCSICRFLSLVLFKLSFDLLRVENPFCDHLIDIIRLIQLSSNLLEGLNFVAERVVVTLTSAEIAFADQLLSICGRNNIQSLLTKILFYGSTVLHLKHFKCHKMNRIDWKSAL